MTESIHARLDREAKRLSELPEGERPTEGFILGVESAANIAFRIEAKTSPGIDPAKPTDLRERMVRADVNLRAKAKQADLLHEEIRLNGKAEGVRLATSYLDEILREMAPTDAVAAVAVEGEGS